MRIEKLFPVCKDYLWGGNKLKEYYGKQTDLTPCAESWELSFHQDGQTLLADGTRLSDKVTATELGENVAEFSFFPVLIKFIDAAQNLSVQVHPSDEYALKNENSLGKTEMWYIVEAQPGAGIYLGFNRDVSKEEYEKAIKENRLTELLNFYEVKAGDCYFIPSGTIHAIGKGCLICEIQQNSNLTYRVYDYGRKDKNGKERELHVDKALAVTKLTKHENNSLNGDLLGVSKYFSVRKLCVKNERLETDEKTFQCLTCVKGFGQIENQPIRKGDSFFVPANYGTYSITGDMELIITEIRKYYIHVQTTPSQAQGNIVDDTGRVLTQCALPLENDISATVEALSALLLNSVNMTKDDIAETIVNA